MTDHKFTIKFERGFLKGRSDFNKEIRKRYWINKIKAILGIYEVWESQVLSEPIFDGNKDSWTYNLKILRVHSYFLYIKYASRDWNTFIKR